MRKKSTSGVLASFRGSPDGAEYDSPLRSLRPRWTAFLRILLAILTLPWHASCPGCITQELTFPQFGSSGGS